MAYLQALSGIARAGVTYSGWVKPSFQATIGGTVRTLVRDDWSIQHSLGGPSLCEFRVRNFTPTIGHDVKVRYAGGGGDYLFGGTLLQAEAEVLTNTNVEWHCIATGYQWLLGQFLVQGTYRDMAINTILARLVASYASSDFSVGYCPHGDRVTVEFDREPLPQAIAKLASLVPGGAWWEVTPDKRINLCTTYPDASIALTGSTASRSVRLHKDLTQARTRTRVVGIGTTVTAAVEPGATSISVAEIGWFTSGEALAGTNDLDYTGVSSPDNVSYGPGTITGVTGVLEPIAEGDSISVVGTYDDTTAQTAMASTLGSPASGIITHWIADPTLSKEACLARAQADVTKYSAAIETVQYSQSLREARVGRLVAASVSSPLTISGNYQIQNLHITPRGKVEGTKLDLDYAVSASAHNQRATGLLARIK
jgi:hypothetical protein